MLTLLFPCALGEQCSCSSPILGAMGGPSSQLHNSGCTGRTVQSASSLWVPWKNCKVSSTYSGCTGRTVQSAPPLWVHCENCPVNSPTLGVLAVRSAPPLWVRWCYRPASRVASAYRNMTMLYECTEDTLSRGTRQADWGHIAHKETAEAPRIHNAERYGRWIADTLHWRTRQVVWGHSRQMDTAGGLITHYAG